MGTKLYVIMRNRAAKDVFQQPRKQKNAGGFPSPALFFPPQLCTSFLFFFPPPASDVKGFSTKMHARGGERGGGGS